MQEIDFKEFKQIGGNPMAGAAADESTFYRLGEDKLGIVAEYEKDEGKRLRASVLLPASLFDGQFRVNDSEWDSGKTGKSVERAREKVTDWMKGKQ